MSQTFAPRRRQLFAPLATDLHHAWRALVHRPLFALLAVLTLALGLGANVLPSSASSTPSCWPTCRFPSRTA